MKIKHWMTSNPITVKPGDPIADASKIMKEHKIRRLPVVEKGKLAGILTHRRMLEAGPSDATTLSVHELNYILANLTVGEVMKKNPVCVSPDDQVSDVILMGHEKGIGAFPVLDRGRLVGIVTETEIFRAMVQIFGNRQEDAMIIIEKVRLKETIGALSRIASIIEGKNIPVLAMFSLPHRRAEGNRLHIRVGTTDTDGITQALEKEGYVLGD